MNFDVMSQAPGFLFVVFSVFSTTVLLNKCTTLGSFYTLLMYYLVSLPRYVQGKEMFVVQ